ncbi:MAG: TRAP transporter large permease [Sedimentibacter sp.]
MTLMQNFSMAVAILMVFLLGGVSLPFCFAASLAYMVFFAGVPIGTLFLYGFNQMISVTLFAVPMFVIAGTLISDSGIAEKLLDVANLFVGKIKGSLGIICVVTCGFIGAISGSAFTGIAAIGPVMIPRMVKEGYERGFATALVSSASVLGMLIPPSSATILYGWSTGSSILAGFLSTVVPGVLVIISFSFINLAYARKHCHAVAEIDEAVLGEAEQNKGSKRRIIITAIPALMMPVIILGGIYGGIFTPSEAASVAAMVALLIGIFVYRTLSPKPLLQVLKTSANSIGGIFTMIFFCYMLSQALVFLKIPQQLVQLFMSITDDKYVMLIIINLFLLCVGMIASDTVGIVLCAPLLLPIVQSYGISPIHFCAIMIVNLAAGGLTPPYASIMYFGMKVGNCKFAEIYPPTMLLLALGYIPVMLLTTYIEPVSMFLPRLMGY